MIWNIPPPSYRSCILSQTLAYAACANPRFHEFSSFPNELGSLRSKTPKDPWLSVSQLIGLREELQENPLDFMGKSMVCH